METGAHARTHTDVRNLSVLRKGIRLTSFGFVGDKTVAEIFSWFSRFSAFFSLLSTLLHSVSDSLQAMSSGIDLWTPQLVLSEAL